MSKLDVLLQGEIEDDKEMILGANELGDCRSVRYDMGFGNETTVQIREYSAETSTPFALDAMEWIVDLPPKEALLLLTWLEQERPRLEELVSHE